MAIQVTGYLNGRSCGSGVLFDGLTELTARTCIAECGALGISPCLSCRHEIELIGACAVGTAVDRSIDLCILASWDGDCFSGARYRDSARWCLGCRGCGKYTRRYQRLYGSGGGGLEFVVSNLLGSRRRRRSGIK